MRYRNLVIFFGFIVTLIYKANAKSKCITPMGVTKPRNRNDVGRYILDIPGNPKTYMPGEKYNVSLKVNPISRTPRSFKNFMVTLESEVDDSTYDPNTIQNVGRFQFGYDLLSMSSNICPNTIIESNALLKTEVQLFWIAPPPNSGCVSIKATVVESKENWYSEDGELTKVLCEETSDNEDTQPPILKHCCACEEAKYEIGFEGLWTRNTHPKDFPSDVWSTKFSEIIGASHKNGHTFWRYGDIASDGVAELSQTGNTRKLEEELKDMSENIRTIIKAKGLHYPNITLTSFAVFRVDNQNHLISVMSKIMPSPDWIVGVSNLELCKSDCTWEESRVLNLFPWDAGTDDGYSYTSPSEPSLVRQPMRRIKSNSPNDPRSPFYNEQGEDMKPIAKLRLNRRRLYEKVCDPSLRMYQPDGELEDDETGPCATTPWNDWSACSNPCGPGFMYRQRSYVTPENEEDCNKILVENQRCFGKSRGCNLEDGDEGVTTGEEEETTEEAVPEDERCELGEWSEWSSCSAVCGKGTRTRDRKYKYPQFSELCGGDLQENEECDGAEECEENSQETDMPEECLSVEIWGEWSPCNETCGTGIKVRYRTMKDDGEDNCPNLPQQEIVECYEPPCHIENFDLSIPTRNQVSEWPRENSAKVINCKVTKWSPWSACKITNGESCGKGYMQRIRYIKVHPKNGGKKCPTSLFKRKKCNIPCEEETEPPTEDPNETSPMWGPGFASTDENEKQQEYSGNECIMSDWTKWSPCSTICGGSSFRQRTRYPVYQPKGVECPERLQEKKCPLPLACTDTGKAPL